MRHAIQALLCVAAFAGVSSVGRVAHADPVSDAKDLFERGRDFRTKGDCTSAAPLFRKAFELYPDGLGSARNLAECEEQLGHFASARRAWLELRRGLVTHTEKKYDGWAQDADEGAARLAPKLATLTIDVSATQANGASTAPTGVDLTLDGEPLSPNLIGAPLERDPGHHVVIASGARVQQPAQQAVDLIPGDAKRVSLQVVLTGDAAAPTPTPLGTTPPAVASDQPAPANNSRATERTIGWISAGVGAAALVGMGVSIGLYESASSTVNGQCPSHSGCSDSLKGTQSQGQTAATAVNVLAIVGGVGIAGGATLLLLSGWPSKSATLAVSPTIGGASAALRF